MKVISMLLTVLFANIALAAGQCPNFQGEYVVMNCPMEGRPFQATRILQPDCRAIGFQNLVYLVDGTVSNYGTVRWEPIGAGKLLEREDKISSYLKEKFFDQDSLYSYSYRVDKATNTTTMLRTEIIDLLRDENIFVSYEVMSPGNMWINLKNCK